jgi:hypothetical protein
MDPTQLARHAVRVAVTGDTYEDTRWPKSRTHIYEAVDSERIARMASMSAALQELRGKDALVAQGSIQRFNCRFALDLA